jgi:hypothetical protein
MFDGHDSRRLLLTGLALGLLFGFLAGTVLTADATTPDATDAPGDSPPLSFSRAGPSCLDSLESDAGWVHVVASGQRWSVTLNATVVHPPGSTVNVNVTKQQTGNYEIALRTVEAADGKTQSRNCRYASRLSLATGLDSPEFSVTLDGRLVREVDQDETVANLYPLPNPVNVTAGEEP